MRSIPLLAALALTVCACADDAAGVEGDSAATTDAEQEDTMSDDSTTDDAKADDSADQGTDPSASVVPDSEEPMAESGEEPSPDEIDGSPMTEPTLALNPTTTVKQPPAPTAGAPIGPNEALFPGQIDTGLTPFIEIATADLAARLGVSGDDITTVSATLVTWPDSSMGCPVPGMEYLQALQDGSLIELELAGTVYRYHSGGDRVTPFLCDPSLASPQAPAG